MDLLEQIPLLRQLSPDLQTLVLRLLMLLVVLLILSLLRRAAVPLIFRPIERLVERSPNQIDNLLLKSAQRPLRLVLIAVALVATTAILDFGPELQAFSSTVSRALFIAAFVFTLYNLIDAVSFTSKSLRLVTGMTIEERLLPFMRVVVKVFLIVIGGLIIMQEFGFDVSGLIASLGIVGLAFSLAAQDTAANVFGFTAIVSDNPFKVGDFIKTPDYDGLVEHVGVRSTRIRRLDQSLVIVPNNALTNAAVINWSRLTKRRIDFQIGLTYDTSSAQMREILERLRGMLRERPNLDPETVVVHFVTFADSSLNIRIIAYALLADWNSWTAEIEAINLEIMDIVESLGLSFAFPSRSLYVETLPNFSVPPPKAEPLINAHRTTRPPSPKSEPSEPLGRDEPSQSNESDLSNPR